MQYKFKIALLAVALFGASALASSYVGDSEYDIKARGVDNDLAACEFYDVYLEARSNPSLDARDLESLNSREHAAVCIKLFFCFWDLKYTGCCRWAPPQTHDEHNVGEHESTSAAYESEHPPHFYD